MNTLGLYGGHDANAALVSDGQLIAATEEERISRQKHHLGAPDAAMLDVLDYGDYDRIAVATPHQDWLKVEADVLVDHHLAHAYYAYVLSGFERAVVLTADGGGDRSWAGVYHINRGRVGVVNESPMWVGRAIGTLYANVTEALGFRQLHDEGKVMGLAAHGDPEMYADLFEGAFSVEKGQLLADPDIDWDGLMAKVGELDRKHVAAALQAYFERIMLAWVEDNVWPNEDLCVAGGVFANVQVNGKLLNKCQRLFVAPAMLDGGLAAGAALYADGAWGNPQYDVRLGYDLGFADADPEELAMLLVRGEMVALAHNRMEYGPRALGSRSILADPRQVDVVDKLNDKLKRVDFMPFAPVILEEYAADVLEGYRGLEAQPSARHMTLTYPVRRKWRHLIPAVVHLDGTARPQVVTKLDGLYYRIVSAFFELTACPLLINTSLNMHGEPIVRTHREAMAVAEQAGLHLVLGEL